MIENSIFFTELLAREKRDAIERDVRHDHDLALVQEPRTGVRGLLASTLIRVALYIDASAGRRTAASVR